MTNAETKFDLEILPRQKIGHYWKELWKYRELFFFLSWRDLLVQYKQTMIGVLWSVLRPLMTIVIFAFVFGRLAHLPSAGIPYEILVFCGMLPWQFFAHALGESSNSLVANTSLVSKTYFPRIIIPATTLAVGLVDFLISFLILCVLLFWNGLWPDWRWLGIPLFLCIACASALGAGLWFAAWNVKYRDFRYVIPYIIQFGLFVSPVGFSASVVPLKWKWVYSLNPMVGVINGFRWSLLNGRMPLDWPAVLMSIGISFILLYLGFSHFQKAEREFADII